ncbi:unnamed protein product, partial [Owenia fusiformis]
TNKSHLNQNLQINVGLNRHIKTTVGKGRIRTRLFTLTFQPLKVMSAASSTYRPKPLVFSGPSGSGKSTLVKKLMGEYKDCFAFSVSHTTRKPRPGEQDGKDYHYVSKESMEVAINNGEFIESACFSGNLYGTSKKAVEEVAKTGRICILDIDMQGVKSVKKTDLNPRYIFIKPPSFEILESRLRGRGTENEDSLNKRLTTAKEELVYAEQKGSYDFIIINDDLETAYARLKAILNEDINQVQSNLVNSDS